MKAMFMLCIIIGLLIVKNVFLCMNYEKEICDKELFLRRKREKEEKREREKESERNEHEGGRDVLVRGMNLLLLLFTLVEKLEACSFLGWLAVVGVRVVCALGEQQGVQQLICISGNHFSFNVRVV
jgi:hypothetical protein